MRINAAGVALIKEYEGCDLAAYQDQGGIWTIGYGHTRGVTPKQTCSLAQANEWLEEDIEAAEDGLRACRLPELNENQWAAMVSFCFNVGFGHAGVKSGFRELKHGGYSTLMVRLLAGDFEGALEEIPKWVNAAGRPSAGLLKRRVAEMMLFERPVDESAP